MRLTAFFRFPELLLLVSMLIGPVGAPNGLFDIFFHDTWFVFGKSSWMGNDLFIYVNGMLLFGWLTHILLRKHAPLAAIWRWVHVGLSVILTLLVGILGLLFCREMGRANRDLLSEMNTWADPLFVSSRLAVCIVLFVLLQLIFWVTAAVALFRGKPQVS